MFSVNSPPSMIGSVKVIANFSNLNIAANYSNAYFVVALFDSRAASHSKNSVCDRTSTTCSLFLLRQDQCVSLDRRSENSTLAVCRVLLRP
jgi:hypothetical protein